jgi:hypothetical protein
MHLGCNVKKENQRRRLAKTGAQRIERPLTKLQAAMKNR